MTIISHSSLSVIELHSSSQSPLGEQAKLGDDELVELCKGRISGVSVRQTRTEGSHTSLGHSCIVDGISTIQQPRIGAIETSVGPTNEFILAQIPHQSHPIFGRTSPGWIAGLVAR